MYGRFREMLFKKDIGDEHKIESSSEVFAKYNQGRIERLREFKEHKDKIGAFPPREQELLMVNLLQHQVHEDLDKIKVIWKQRLLEHDNQKGSSNAENLYKDVLKARVDYKVTNTWIKLLDEMKDFLQHVDADKYEKSPVVQPLIKAWEHIEDFKTTNSSLVAKEYHIIFKRQGRVKGDDKDENVSSYTYEPNNPLFVTDRDSLMIEDEKKDIRQTDKEVHDYYDVVKRIFQEHHRAQMDSYPDGTTWKGKEFEVVEKSQHVDNEDYGEESYHQSDLRSVEELLREAHAVNARDAPTDAENNRKKAIDRDLFPEYRNSSSIVYSDNQIWIQDLEAMKKFLERADPKEYEENPLVNDLLHAHEKGKPEYVNELPHVKKALHSLEMHSRQKFYLERTREEKLRTNDRYKMLIGFGELDEITNKRAEDIEKMHKERSIEYVVLRNIMEDYYDAKNNWLNKTVKDPEAAERVFDQIQEKREYREAFKYANGINKFLKEEGRREDWSSLSREADEDKYWAELNLLDASSVGLPQQQRLIIDQQVQEKRERHQYVLKLLADHESRVRENKSSYEYLYVQKKLVQYKKAKSTMGKYAKELYRVKDSKYQEELKKIKGEENYRSAFSIVKAYGLAFNEHEMQP